MKTIFFALAALYALPLHADTSSPVFSLVFQSVVNTTTTLYDASNDNKATLVRQLLSDVAKGRGCHYQTDRHDYYVSKDRKLGCELTTNNSTGWSRFFCFFAMRYQNGGLTMGTIDQITDNGVIHNIRIDLEGHCL